MQELQVNEWLISAKTCWFYLLQRQSKLLFPERLPGRPVTLGRNLWELCPSPRWEGHPQVWEQTLSPQHICVCNGARGDTKTRGIKGLCASLAAPAVWGGVDVSRRNVEVMPLPESAEESLIHKKQTPATLPPGGLAMNPASHMLTKGLTSSVTEGYTATSNTQYSWALGCHSKGHLPSFLPCPNSRKSQRDVLLAHVPSPGTWLSRHPTAPGHRDQVREEGDNQSKSQLAK